ncbi:phage tail fiber protein [Candidatus Termititenax persephonae]|uniref:Phage tail fiber protein n=1 Tax=Candidatus Termititenax persephonae TaxID=2218525 RepID=A0A388TJL7_9BACT|nr:phage tail fiber protein [Candidatus Termititenax persephonae]
MADNYGDQVKYKSDPYNIDSEKKITASGVRTALGTKEDVANKQDTITDNSTYYPSAKAVYAHTSSTSNPHGVTAAQVGLGSVNNTSDANKPISTATQAAITAEATNRVNADAAINAALSAEATARANADTAINTALSGKQAALPIGTILMYKGTGWVDNSTLPGWYACTSANTGRGCPNLVDKFLRGGSSSDGTGGADSQTVAVPLKSHNHTFIGTAATGSINADNNSDHQSAFENVSSASGVFSTSTFASRTHFADGGGQLSSLTSLNFSMTPSGTISTEGEDGPSITIDTVPSYFTVIYIMKIS